MDRIMYGSVKMGAKKFKQIKPTPFNSKREFNSYEWDKFMLEQEELI